MTVLGYLNCRECGVPVLDVIAHKTGNLCPQHHREHVASRIETFELRGKELRVPLPNNKPKTEWEKGDAARKNARRRDVPEVRRKEHLRERAKTRAYKRLRSLFPEVFDLLLVQEREKVGLPGWSLNMALTPETADETLAFIESYHRRNGDLGRSDPVTDGPDEAAPGQ